SIASHQLRTPLTAIKGYTSMTLEGSYGEITLKVRGVLDKVFQSANRLIYIVNDLLDISRIEQGRFQLAFEDVKVANVLRDIVEELKPNAEKRNIAVSFSVSPDDADVTASADFNKIRQVFTNIIDNAIKYTPQGSVAVSVERRTNGVVVAVKDTGLGIAPVTLQNLFQKFTRAKGVTKLHTDGSGLGLYVAKEIMKAHHGAVWAESEGEGKGSQFYIQLPFKQPENATPVSLAA
ncbi:MAG: HAMP domain-containing sensor histidine kinase, partial [Patescibacteria group bacterium]